MRVCKKSKRRLRWLWRIAHVRKFINMPWQDFKRYVEICNFSGCFAVSSKNTLYQCCSNKTYESDIVLVCNAHKPVQCSVCTSTSDPMGKVRRCYACQKAYCKEHYGKLPLDFHTEKPRCCKPEECYRWGCECRKPRIAKCGWDADDANTKQCEQWSCDCRLLERSECDGD